MATRNSWEDRIRDKYEPKVARAVLRAMDQLRQSYSVDEIEELLDSGTLANVVQRMQIDNRLRPLLMAHVLRELHREIEEAGRTALRESLAPQIDAIPTDNPEIAISFDMMRPESVAFLQTYDGNLIRQLSDDTRQGVVAVVRNAFENGGSSREQARTIRNQIGLTEYQANAVQNFRRMLENNQLEALTRALRDKRFDATVRRAALDQKPLSRAQIDRMVARYHERFLQHRARAIARTETVRASSMGQRSLWRQAVADGFMDQNNVRRIWVTAGDERVRDEHRQIPGMNPDGVGLDEPFQTPDGPVMDPPAGVNCRCTVRLEIRES